MRDDGDHFCSWKGRSCVVRSSSGRPPCFHSVISVRGWYSHDIWEEVKTGRITSLGIPWDAMEEGWPVCDPF